MQNLPPPRREEEGADVGSAVLATSSAPGRTLIEFDLSPVGASVVAGVTTSQPMLTASKDNAAKIKLQRCPDLAPVWRYLTKENYCLTIRRPGEL
jgi:hypothetical protein